MSKRRVSTLHAFGLLFSSALGVLGGLSNPDYLSTLSGCSRYAPQTQTGSASIDPARPNTIIHNVFVCENRQKLQVIYDNPHSTAQIVFPKGEQQTLKQKRAGSGIWYTNAAFDWRGKGDHAALTSTGKKAIHRRVQPSTQPGR